ncbi:MAG TPA: hypothetical protein VJ044_00060, partial [Candidatus Hodarchaeales archaeon]|nr:hypothetical protein [Candidatus Hodarchaeales archaeon]
MGYLRLLKQSLIFGLRSRRILVFTLIFGILTGVTLFAVDSIFQESSTELLRNRSVILQVKSFSSGLTTAEADSVVNNVNAANIADVHRVRYAELGSAVYLFSLSSNPWQNPEVLPKDIKAGSYVTNFDEQLNGHYQVLGSLNYESSLVSGNIGGSFSLDQSLAVGTQISFRHNSEKKLSLEVVGLFQKEAPASITESTGHQWLYISNAGFDDVMTE